MRPYDIEKGLTADRVRSLLKYRPETGQFFWRTSNNQVSVGSEAGSRMAAGYVRITIDGHRYLAHRIAWLYMTDEWPKSRIDHRDADKTNNRWKNLREADDVGNKANQRVRKDNKLKVKGVQRIASGRYKARIYVGNKSHYLGLFDTIQEAHCAYSKAADELFGEFARAE